MISLVSHRSIVSQLPDRYAPLRLIDSVSVRCYDKVCIHSGSGNNRRIPLLPSWPSSNPRTLQI